MSARSGAIAGGLLLLALTACGRAPPIPTTSAAGPSSPSAEGQPVVLAGGPDASGQPPALAGGPDQPAVAASDAPAPVGDASVSAAPSDAAPSPSDPLEPVNRRLYAVDAALGKAIKKRPQLAPLAQPRARAVLRAANNALSNLDEPTVAANDLLQRKLARAGRTAVRFVINSTVGMAGLFDVASRLGIKRRDNSLDRTLASYGAPAGPYVYLPVAGPATLRAVVAMAAEGYLYPPHWMHLAASVNTAFKGAGYAKLAGRVVERADGAAPGPPAEDGYVRTRRAYYAARTAAPPAELETGGRRPTALASVSEQGQ